MEEDDIIVALCNMETVCSIDVLLRGITPRVFEFEFYSKTALLSLAFSLHVFSLVFKNARVY
jgi:hypothetical protein